MPPHLHRVCVFPVFLSLCLVIINQKWKWIQQKNIAEACVCVCWCSIYYYVKYVKKKKRMDDKMGPYKNDGIFFFLSKNDIFLLLPYSYYFMNVRLYVHSHSRLMIAMIRLSTNENNNHNNFEQFNGRIQRKGFCTDHECCLVLPMGHENQGKMSPELYNMKCICWRSHVCTINVYYGIRNEQSRSHVRQHKI